MICGGLRRVTLRSLDLRSPRARLAPAPDPRRGGVDAKKSSTVAVSNGGDRDSECERTNT